MRKRKKDTLIIDEWRAHYADGGFDANFRDIIIPHYDEELYRSVLMPAHRDLPLNATLTLVRKNSDVETYPEGDNLDMQIPHNARSRTIGSYVILVRKGFEPDQEYLDKSAKEIDPYLMIGMNARERLIFGDKVYMETGRHLDVEGWTVCTGSRGAGDGVPRVGLSGGKVRVGWDYPRLSGTRSGLREVVS